MGDFDKGIAMPMVQTAHDANDQVRVSFLEIFMNAEYVLKNSAQI